MAEEIKNLIDKIYSEGMQAGEAKAAQIQTQAKAEAEDILNKAKKQAEALVVAAEQNIRQLEEKNKALLNQAGRDMLLSLRKEINSLLERIITQDLRSALGPDVLHKVILEAIKNYGTAHKQEIVISLKKEDADELSKHFLSRLKEETKQNIVLKPSEDIIAGFTISFDAGRSQFDFTDKALAEYISLYVKPNLKDILEGAI